MKTACCDYQCKDDDFGPVFTNTGNNVVQCHNCGEGYVPRSEVDALKTALEAARVALSKWPIPHHSGKCAGWSDPDGDFAGCDCGCDAKESDRQAARLALGLEAKP